MDAFFILFITKHSRGRWIFKAEYDGCGIWRNNVQLAYVVGAGIFLLYIIYYFNQAKYAQVSSESRLYIIFYYQHINYF